MLCNLYIISFFIPLEVFFNWGGLRLEPYRVLLIIGFIKYIAGKQKKDDGCTILNYYILFTFISLIVNHGFEFALKTSGILYLEVCISYLMGVMFIRDIESLKKKIYLLASLYIIIMLPSLIEFFTGNKIIHSFFEKITGHKQLAENLYSESYIRLGFTRTTSVFSHPILYSISATFIIPIFISLYSLEAKKKTIHLFKKMSGLIVAVFIALTSAGISVIIIQIALRWWYKNQYKIGNLRKIIITSFYTLLVIIHFGSNRGVIKFIATSITLNPQTAYYRILQWEYTLDDIANNLFFGIGYNDFTHPEWFASSVDSYWLLNMLQYGALSTIFLSYFFIKLLKKTYFESTVNDTNNVILLGFRLLIISIIFVGFTVDFFDKLQPLMYFLLGASSWLFKEINKENYENKNIVK
ncbi:MAG: hypothetical protein KAH20_11215 [Methylococcales bacterium]|nr:hypothetical protein [Methylococcales bacterium]